MVLKLQFGLRLLPLAYDGGFDFLPLADVGLYAVTTVIIPAFVSYLIFWLSYQYLQHHLFIYFFVAGFLNGAVTMVIHLLCGLSRILDFHL